MNLMNHKKYCQAITNIHGILKLWRMINIPIEDKIVVFETRHISKLVYLALLTVIPNHIIDEVAKIQKSYIWDNSSPKIKNNDVSFNYFSLQCLGVKKLSENKVLEDFPSFYKQMLWNWKNISLHLL